MTLTATALIHAPVPDEPEIYERRCPVHRGVVVEGSHIRQHRESLTCRLCPDPLKRWLVVHVATGAVIASAQKDGTLVVAEVSNRKESCA